MADKEKYYMFVDECGDQNLSAFDENFPIFTLCGVLMSQTQLVQWRTKLIRSRKSFGATRL